MEPKLLRPLKPEQIKWHPCQQGMGPASLMAEIAYGSSVAVFDVGIGVAVDMNRVAPTSTDSINPYDYHEPEILRVKVK